jgi:hypothetical protein
VAKDRASPFSRKHRRYWLPVTGGMILIGVMNVAIGYCAYPGDKVVYRRTEQIIPVLPVLHRDAAPAPASPDAAPAPDASPR